MREKREPYLSVALHVDISEVDALLLLSSFAAYSLHLAWSAMGGRARRALQYMALTLKSGELGRYCPIFEAIPITACGLNSSFK